MNDRMKMWSFIISICALIGGWTWNASTLASDITDNGEDIVETKKFVENYINNHSDTHKELRNSYVKANNKMSGKIDKLTDHIAELTKAVTVLSTINKMEKEGYRK